MGVKWVPRENQEHIENRGMLYASRYFHKMIPDGETYDKGRLFYIHFETETAYYGVPVEGLGLYDCMLLKTDVRKPTEQERDSINGSVVSYGGTSYPLKYKEVISKINKDES